MPHLLLAGHFGCGNLGDDAIMLGFVQKLSAEFDVTVMSEAPEETFRLYGLRAIPRKDGRMFQEELAKTDALVFPGGSIFQDVTSVASVMHYAGLVNQAKKAKKKVCMVGQGVGPLTKFFGKRYAVGAFNATDVLVVRDPQSPTTLKELGVRVPVRVAADCAFLLPEPVLKEESTFGVGSMKSVGIAPRPIVGQEKKMIEVFGQFCRLLAGQNVVPVLIEMDAKHDGPMIQEISKSQGGKIPEIRRLQTPMQVQNRLARLETVVAVRLHAGVLATTVNVPAMMISYDPKVEAFAKMMEVGAALPLEGLTAQRLLENFQSFVKDRERNLRQLERRKAELIKLAELNVEAVEDCLTIGSRR